MTPAPEPLSSPRRPALANIRPAGPGDLAAVAELAGQWAGEQLTRNYRADSEAELRRRLGPGFLIAEREGQLVGYVIGEVRATAGNEFVEGVLDDRPAYLEVQDLYVAAAHRRRGLGRQLMRHLLAVAEQQGVSGSLVYSANHDYLHTARFYESLGYRMWHIHMTRNGKPDRS